MSSSPQDLLNLAQQLLNLDIEGEAHYRAAGSRAYYAAYHACNVKYQAVGMRDVGMHRAFIQSLIESPDRLEKSIGYILDDIYRNRIQADYHLDVAFSATQASNAVNNVQRVFEKLR